MKSKGKEGLSPLTCPSPSLPGSSSPDRRLDSCSRRLRVWEWKKDIRTKRKLVLFPIATNSLKRGHRYLQSFWGYPDATVYA